MWKEKNTQHSHLLTTSFVEIILSQNAICSYISIWHLKQYSRGCLTIRCTDTSSSQVKNTKVLYGLLGRLPSSIHYQCCSEYWWSLWLGTNTIVHLPLSTKKKLLIVCTMPTATRSQKHQWRCRLTASMYGITIKEVQGQSFYKVEVLILGSKLLSSQKQLYVAQSRHCSYCDMSTSCCVAWQRLRSGALLGSVR
jgi:hypothetical protein